MDQECIFCKIVAGEIPSTKVYEDEHAYAFADTNPQAPTHVLVVPKKHLTDLADVGRDPEAAAGSARRHPRLAAQEELTRLPDRLQHRRGRRAERVPRARARPGRSAHGLAARLTGRSRAAAAAAANRELRPAGTVEETTADDQKAHLDRTTRSLGQLGSRLHHACRAR